MTNTISQRAMTERWPTQGMGGIVSNGLVCALDAGVSASYSGSGTTWSNLVAAPADGSAQSAYNFTTSGLTFQGAAGRRDASTNFSTAGSGWADIGSNTTFINSLHKDSAALTMAWWVRIADYGGAQELFSTYSTGAGVGFNVAINGTSGTISVLIGRGGTEQTIDQSAFIVPLSTYTFVGLVIDEAATTGFWYLNGAQETFTSTYSGPSASNASNTARIGAVASSGIQPFRSGGRLCQYYLWNRALVRTELDTVFNNTRARWGV